MNTWFTDVVKDANERAFNDHELERIMVYYSGMPSRLRVAETIELAEREMVANLLGDLERKYPGRTLYSRRLIRDLLESLRHLTHALLADEPRLFRRRFIDHLTRTVAELDIDPTEVRDVYDMIRERLDSKLGVQGRELIQPYFDELSDVLTPALAAR